MQWTVPAPSPSNQHYPRAIDAPARAESLAAGIRENRRMPNGMGALLLKRRYTVTAVIHDA